jgi:hypothetical protein
VFRYWDKGSLATIGRAAAVADFGRIHISGYLAWLAWLFVHILFLIGFRNRLLVFIQWAWSYVTFERGARLSPAAHDFRGGQALPQNRLLRNTNKNFPPERANESKNIP